MCPSDYAGEDVNVGSERDVVLDGNPPTIPLPGPQPPGHQAQLLWELHGRTTLEITHGLDGITGSFCRC